MPDFSFNYECSFCDEEYKQNVYIEEDLSDILDIGECPNCKKSPEDLNFIDSCRFNKMAIEMFVKEYEEEYDSHRERVWEYRMDR